jgi:hypothetical protein
MRMKNKEILEKVFYSSRKTQKDRSATTESSEKSQSIW